MGQAKRKTPDAMPTAEMVAQANQGLQSPMLVAGSRGDKRLRNPDYAVHALYGTVGDLPNVGGKHIILFVHGYNVNRREALGSAAGFFSQMQDSLVRDGKALADYAYVLFTWPGDVGPLWFCDAQKFAQHSGVALYLFARDLVEDRQAASLTLVTHSLGAHVGLRSATVLGERIFRDKTGVRFDHVLLLAPAVENDVFRRPWLLEKYHFPESAFAIGKLNLFASRADDVLGSAFAASELDRALGYAGPESMGPLVSLSQRVTEVTAGEHTFNFELHDFSPNSTTIMNPALHVHHHSDYWGRREQTDYYVNLI